MPSTFTIVTPAPRRKAEPPGGNGRSQVYLLVKTGGGSGPGLDGPGIDRLEAGLPLTDIAARLEALEGLPAYGPLPTVATPPPAASRQSLTARQHQILTALCDGASNKQIGHALGIMEGTVKIHLKTIFRVLGVKNRTQAAMMALRRDC